MYELALFAGAGGGILGGMLCGHTIVGAVEIEEYPREVLKQRQRDGILDQFPIWDDVTTFRIDNPECKEYIGLLRTVKDELVISGGFPCQDISSAGKGAGIKKGTRSGLWFEFSRIISEIRPARVLLENSPLLISRGLDIVLCGLAEMGYDASWGIVSAADVGARHKRERLWIIADSNKKRQQDACRWSGQEKKRKIRVIFSSHYRKGIKLPFTNVHKAVHTRKYDALARGVDQRKAIGNGQVSAVVPLAWELLT